MAEYDDDIEEAPPPAAAQSPLMQQFQDVFPDPRAREWAAAQAARVNDYTTRRQIADANTAAGENFVRDMEGFKSGLVSGVQNDPFFVHTALDIVGDTIPTIGALMPNAPTGIETHHSALTRHMQSEIAAAAVTMLAETHEGAARGMLADERIAAVLGEGAGALGAYIGMQAKARSTDHAAAVERMQAQGALAADTMATNYLASMIDPASNTVTFPAGFNQGVLADPRLPPPIKAGVLAVYDRLRASGDIETSDPLVITDAIRRAANGEPPPAGELLPQAGTTLTAKDAIALTRMMSLSPAAQVEAQQMQATLDAARRQIAPPEYGAAGQAAYGRFVNWFVDEYGRMGPGSLNPKLDNWILGGENGTDPVSRFMPNGTDLLVTPARRFGLNDTADRPSLADIFSGKMRLPPPRPLDDLTDKSQPVSTPPGGPVGYDNPELEI